MPDLRLVEFECRAAAHLQYLHDVVTVGACEWLTDFTTFKRWNHRGKYGGKTFRFVPAEIATTNRDAVDFFSRDQLGNIGAFRNLGVEHFGKCRLAVGRGSAIIRNQNMRDMIFRCGFGSAGFGAQKVFDFLARNFDATIHRAVLELADDQFLA